MSGLMRSTAGFAFDAVSCVFGPLASLCVDRVDPRATRPRDVRADEAAEGFAATHDAFAADPTAVDLDCEGEGYSGGSVGTAAATQATGAGPDGQFSAQQQRTAAGFPSPVFEPFDSAMTVEQCEQRCREYEKEYEQLNQVLRQMELQLLEAKERCVIQRPLSEEDCRAQAEQAAQEIFDLKNAGRHINLAGEVFDVEEMLQKVRCIRDEFPTTSELKNTYDTLEAELSHANGRKLEKKQELVGELDHFLSLKRDVLKLQTVEQIVQDCSLTKQEVLEVDQEDGNPNVRPEFFDQSKVREAKLRKRVLALLAALGETSKLEEGARLLSSQQASLVDLETYFAETKERLVKDAELLKRNKAAFKLAQSERSRELEEAKLKLRFEKDDLIESIRIKRAQIEHDMNRLVGVVVSIREKEKEEDRMHKVDHKVEEILAETQRVLSARVDDTQAGTTIARIQQGIGEGIKATCTKALLDRRHHLAESILQSHCELYTVCRTHWNKSVLKHHQAAESLKELRRQLSIESNALRKQKKGYSEDKLADKGIIRLQEALYEQRLRLVNEKKAETEHWKKELNAIDSVINQMGTLKALRESPKYAHYVERDFRDEFLKSEKQREFVEWIDNVKDLVATVCDMKEGLVNSAKDFEPNTECVENLLDALESLDERGVQNVQQILASKSDVKTHLRMMHNIIRDAVENDSINPNVIVYGRSLRAALTTVKSKLFNLLQPPITRETISADTAELDIATPGSGVRLTEPDDLRATEPEEPLKPAKPSASPAPIAF